MTRWVGRLRSSAKMIVQAFQAMVSNFFGQALIRPLSKIRTREDFIALLRSYTVNLAARAFAGVASWVHRVLPGVRLV